MNACRISTILLLVLVGGCDRSSDPRPVAPVKSLPETTAIPEIREPSEETPLSTPAEIPDAVDQTTPDQAGADATDTATLNTSVPIDATENDPSDSESNDSESNEVESNEPSVQDNVNRQRDAADYRLWLPTAAGPVLVDLDLFVDNQPLRQAFDQKLKLVLRELAVDDDSDPANRLSWEQLIERVAADPTTFGQASAQVSGQAKGMIKRYDRNQNAVVDQDELVRFLYRDSNFASEFRLFGTDAFRWSNRSDSKLFAAIDRNDDRKLDRGEIEMASESLLRNVDQNADECLSLMEATIQLPSNEDAWRRSRSNRQGNVAMDLAGYVNWSNLSYAMGGLLKSNQAFVGSTPVSQLDVNQDQGISADEAESVLDIPAAIHLVGRFGGAASGVQVSIESHADQIDPTNRIGPVEQLGPAGTWISTPRLQIGIVLIDTTPSQNRIPREVFDQLDANNDGAIDETEIPDGAQSQLPLDSLDENSDGKLTFMEINQAVKQSESIWNYQIRGRGAEHPDGMFAWLDDNHDQFLSSREVQAAKKRLSSLLDATERIRPTDVPDTFVIQLSRGEPQQDTTRFQFTRQMIESKEHRPQWALRMDANRDGEISETEFIGPIDTFERLDLNADHFLTADEVSVTL